ncbi:MAG: hypothetical protein DRJ96_06930 [Thermoprotei archaeon]|nr:MAG: hypothetical protein DRJ67_09125 [Thermoprotei archaeon]RLE96322.1 MAG: hypothetical protein DRJ96_06930 [Thermoprotei archaeon]
MELRERVLNLVREYYREKGSPPSMRHIARVLKVSTRTLYRAFPGGITQIYEMAGVPVAAGRRRVPESLAEFYALYRRYLSRRGCGESLGTLLRFIREVSEFVKARLGQAAVERLEEKPLSTFNKIARLYLEVEGGEG